MDPVLQKPAGPYKSEGHLDPAGFQQHVTFHAYAPPEDLSAFLVHFWSIRWNRAGQEPYVSEQVMHRPFVDVFVSKDGSGIQTTFRNRRDYEAADEGRIIGARFHPGAFHAFWHGALAGMHDATLDLEQVFPAADRAFVETLLAQDDAGAVAQLTDLLRDRKPKPDPNIGLISQIIATIEAEGLQTVAAVATRVGKSERWLQQLFQDYVGIGVKWLLQRNKLLEAARTIRETETPDWAGLAYDLDYSSQQHFITDFKRVLGKTPVQYKRDLTAPANKA